MTFFKNPKKCVFAPPRRSYIPNFRWIAQKLRPAASGQTDNRQHTTHNTQLTDNSHGPTIPSNLNGPTIGTAEQGCAYGARWTKGCKFTTTSLRDRLRRSLRDLINLLLVTAYHDKYMYGLSHRSMDLTQEPILESAHELPKQ